MSEKTPLFQNSDDLTDMIIAWYRQKIREDYCMHSLYDQLLRSATSIGANIAESQFSQSNVDYKSKMHIALKEANETKYWIIHLTIDGSINEELNLRLFEKIQNIINILISITGQGAKTKREK